MAYEVAGRDITQVEELEQGELVAVADRELSALDRLKNLVWIKRNTVYREALEDWERQTKSVGERRDRREKRSQELTNQIYNVVGFFSVFQGVILTAVTQLASQQNCSGSTPICGKVWFPVVLSSLAAVTAVLGIGLKFSAVHSIHRLMHEERLELRDTIKREKALRQKGENFFFRDLEDPKQSPLKSYWLLKASAIIGGVIAFTVNVINGLTREKIVLKAGNGDMYRTLKEIPHGRNHVVNVETSATYREFLCVESESKLQLKLTSDDFIAISEVKITGHNESRSELLYSTKPRELNSLSEMATDANIARTVKGLRSWVTTLFTSCPKKDNEDNEGNSTYSTTPPGKDSEDNERSNTHSTTPPDKVGVVNNTLINA